MSELVEDCQVYADQLLETRALGDRLPEPLRRLISDVLLGPTGKGNPGYHSIEQYRLLWEVGGMATHSECALPHKNAAPVSTIQKEEEKILPGYVCSNYLTERRVCWIWFPGSYTSSDIDAVFLQRIPLWRLSPLGRVIFPTLHAAIGHEKPLGPFQEEQWERVASAGTLLEDPSEREWVDAINAALNTKDPIESYVISAPDGGIPRVWATHRILGSDARFSFTGPDAWIAHAVANHFRESTKRDRWLLRYSSEVEHVLASLPKP